MVALSIIVRLWPQCYCVQPASWNLQYCTSFTPKTDVSCVRLTKDPSCCSWKRQERSLNFPRPYAFRRDRNQGFFTVQRFGTEPIRKTFEQHGEGAGNGETGTDYGITVQFVRYSTATGTMWRGCEDPGRFRPYQDQQLPYLFESGATAVGSSFCYDFQTPGTKRTAAIEIAKKKTNA